MLTDYLCNFMKSSVEATQPSPLYCLRHAILLVALKDLFTYILRDNFTAILYGHLWSNQICLYTNQAHETKRVLDKDNSALDEDLEDMIIQIQVQNCTIIV